jgi:hypothetical protein
MRLRMPRHTIWRWLLLWTIAGYIVLCLALFVIYVKPSFLGGNHLRIGADSEAYLLAAGVLHDNSANSEEIALVSFSGNFLGPVLIAKLIPNLTGIALMNLMFFLICLWVVDTLPGVNTGMFFWAMVLNPLTTPSLLTLNKEILSCLSIILFIKYISDANRSRWLLFAVLLTAMIARWEQITIIILFLALEHRWSPLRGRHWLTLFLMIFGITLLYPVLVNTAVVNVAALIGVSEGGNVMPRLNDIQAQFGFPLIVLPKILLNLWGEVLRPTYFWTDYLKGDFTDIQNFFAIPFHCVTMFVVCMIALFKKKLDMRKQSVYWMAIYLVATAATPFFQPRYQFPVYVILCLEICGFASPLRLPEAARQKEMRLRQHEASLQRS